MKTTFLYTLSDPETGKIRYLGKSDNPFKRYKAHLNRLGGRPSHKKSWIKGLKTKGLVPFMDLLDEVPDSQWKFWEKEYIRVFRAIGLRLTNYADGGEGTSLKGSDNPFYGKKHTDESRKLIREKRAVQVISDVERQTKSVAMTGEGNHMFGKPVPEERRRRISEKNRGRKLSEEVIAARGTPEAKEKMRLARIGNKKAKGEI